MAKVPEHVRLLNFFTELNKFVRVNVVKRRENAVARARRIYKTFIADDAPERLKHVSKEARARVIVFFIY